MAINISSLNPTFHPSRAGKEIDGNVEHPSARGLAHKKSESSTITVSPVAQVMGAASDYRDSLVALKNRAKAATLQVSQHGASVAKVKAKVGSEIKRDTESFRVQVHQLAQKMELATAKIEDATSDLGSGTVKIASATSSVEINVTGNVNDVADAINADENNTLVTATVEGEGESARIVLRAKESGSSAKFSVNVKVSEEGDNGQSLRILNFNDHARNATERVVAQDSQVTVNDKHYVHATNEIDIVAGGITLQLTGHGTSQINIVDKDDSALASDFNEASAVFADRLVVMAKHNSEARGFIENFLFGNNAKGAAVNHSAVLAKIEAERVKEPDQGNGVAINLEAFDTALKQASLPTAMTRALADPLESDTQSLFQRLVSSLKDHERGYSEHAPGHNKQRETARGSTESKADSSPVTPSQKHQDELRESVKRASDIEKMLKGVVSE